MRVQSASVFIQGKARRCTWPPPPPPAFARAGFARAGCAKRSNAAMDENGRTLNTHFQVSWVYVHWY